MAQVLLKHVCRAPGNIRGAPDRIIQGRLKITFMEIGEGLAWDARVYLPMCITQDSLFLLISYTGLVFFGDSLGVELVHLLSPEE